MLPYLRERAANSAARYPAAMPVRETLASARRQVGTLLGASPEQADEAAIFTGCATEANNPAIRGPALTRAAQGCHLITCTVAHSSTRAPAPQLEREGREITVLPVEGHDRVASGELADALRPDTMLVTIMHANNEVGTIQPIPEPAGIARPYGTLFHTDAAQSVGNLLVSAVALGVDLLTVAGHKLRAPKGMGALSMWPGIPWEHLLPGGGRKRSPHSGTGNMPGIIALGAACALAYEASARLPAHLARMRDRFHEQRSAANALVTAYRALP